MAKKVKTYVSPELNESGDTCTLRNLTLKVGQMISFKGTSENLISMGKIIEFRYPGYLHSDTESVWMNIKDVENKDKSEWVSVGLWEEQNDKGYFKNITAKEKVNASTEPEDTEDLPF